MLWASPLALNQEVTKSLSVETLIESSPQAWISNDSSLSPESKPETEKATYPLAMTLEGPFISAFKSVSNASEKAKKEVESDEESKENESSLYQELSKTGRVLEQAVAGAKLAVLASSEMVSDLGLGVGNYYSGLFGLRGDYTNAILLIQNLADWAVADDSLASIRTAGPSSRILRAMSKEEEAELEKMNYGIALCALLLIALISILPRRLSQV